MRRYIYILVTALLAISVTTPLRAQHTFGVMAGYGESSDAIYPVVEGRSLYGLFNYGVSWRTYSAERFVGGFGIDLLYLERGFSYSPNASLALEGEELHYYSRQINSIMLPIVWQPCFYVADHRVRVFFEAAATLSYDISSTYDNDYQRNLDGGSDSSTDDIYSGKYEYKTARDNRLGYGLAGGGGLALLLGRYEFLARARYYFGLSDVVRNRNKYYTNNNDGYENPFSITPIRSSLNQLTISFGVNYHFGREGFDSWDVKRIKVKMGREFDFKGEDKSSQKGGQKEGQKGGQDGGQRGQRER